MLFGFLLTIYIFCSLILALIILVQKGKGSTGLINFGGASQVLFGGSGGQDLFQKMTWGLGAIFIAGSLLLSIMKTGEYQRSRYFAKQDFSLEHLPASAAESQQQMPTEEAGQQLAVPHTES